MAGGHDVEKLVLYEKRRRHCVLPAQSMEWTVRRWMTCIGRSNVARYKAKSEGRIGWTVCPYPLEKARARRAFPPRLRGISRV